MSDASLPADQRGWLRYKPLNGWGIAIRNGNERKAMLCGAFYFTRKDLYADNPGIKQRPEALVVKVRICQGWKND